MTGLKLARSASALVLVLGAAPAAFGQAPTTQACVTVGGLNNSQPLCGIDSSVPTTLSGTNFGVGGIPLGSGTAAALAQFGTLKASTSATELLFPAQGASSNGSASALALTRDSLAISNPTLNGTQGFVDFRIEYAWLFSNSEAGSDGQFNTADVVLEFGAGAAYARRQHAQGAQPGSVESILIPIELIGDNLTALDADLGSFFAVRMPFIFGVEYNLRQSLSLGSNASFGATASIDAFNSAYWGGMVVRDENLNLVSFTAESGSGTDYTRSFVPDPVVPVPEPGSWLLVALGLMALGAHHRGRQHRPRVG